MIKIGLTGSIGMGKTRTAALFEELGVPVYDADAEVHRLYAKGGAAVTPIAKVFPSAVIAGEVNRDRLADLVLGDADALDRLERVVHPLVVQRQQERLATLQSEGAKMVVLDIPLLFEKERENSVDVVVVVSAPPHIQRERVLERAGMSQEKLDALLARQVPDSVKRAKADYIVETDKGVAHALRQVEKIVGAIRQQNS